MQFSQFNNLRTVDKVGDSSCSCRIIWHLTFVSKLLNIDAFKLGCNPQGMSILLILLGNKRSVSL